MVNKYREPTKGTLGPAKTVLTHKENIYPKNTPSQMTRPYSEAGRVQEAAYRATAQASNEGSK